MGKSLKLSLGLFLLVLFVVTIPTPLLAQSVENEFTFKTTPTSPLPNERVSVEVESLSVNLNNYFITWYLDGRKQQGNYGLTEFTFITGSVGTVSQVSAVIQLNSEQVVRKTLNISPVELDILWEAVDSYTPPFYRGKALPNSEGKIKFVAIPQTKTISPNQAYDLVYYWTKNRKSVAGSSGYGRQAYTLTRDLLNPNENIGVTINDRSENAVAQKTITTPENFDPEILVYLRDSNNKLLLNKALSDSDQIIGLPFTLSAQPYFFSKSIGNLSFNWDINNQNIVPEDEFSPMDITLYPESGVTSADISVTVENLKKLYESAIANLLINV